MPSKTTSILLGGVAAGVLAQLVSLVPVIGGCLCCLVYLGAGVLAVWHYTNTYELTVSGGEGAGMGALAGIVAALMGAILGWLLVAAGLMPDPAEAMLLGFEQAAEQNPDMEEFTDQMTVWAESGALWIVSVLISLLVGALLAALGGVIGASTFKKGSDEVY